MLAATFRTGAISETFLESQAKACLAVNKRMRENLVCWNFGELANVKSRNRITVSHCGEVKKIKNEERPRRFENQKLNGCSLRIM